MGALSPSIRAACSTPTRPSCRWSLLIEFAAQVEDAFRVQPQEQMTSQRGFSVLVNGSWAATASAATSHKPAARPVALPRPLRVSLLPWLADGFLLGRGDRAALERT